MELEQVQKKIAKLLALSKSANQHEALSALTKARELMAQYKLQPVLFEMNEVVRHGTGISFTRVSEPWVSQLCSTIAQNHRCRVVLRHVHGKRTYQVELVGEKDDYEICKEIMQYAVKIARNGAKKARDLANNAAMTDAKSLREVAKAYGIGFNEGVHAAFAKQTKEMQWGLVMQTPQSVNDYMKTIQIKQRPIKISISAEAAKARLQGQTDGKQFVEQKRIEERRRK